MERTRSYHPSKEENEAWGTGDEVTLRGPESDGSYWFWCLAGIAVMRDDLSAIAFVRD